MKIQKVLGLVCVAVAISLLSVNVAEAQMGRLLGGDNNEYALLTDKKVQAELELVDDQVKELEEIQEEAMSVMRDMMSEMQDLSREERGDAMRGFREKMTEKMKPVQEKIKDVLLPHQRDRLKQLGVQSSSRGDGAAGPLSNEKLLDELDVSDKQRKELEEAIKKAKEEMAKKVKEMEQEVEKDILKILDSDQRKKYRELVGEPFKFEKTDRVRGGRGSFRGTRGGRGRGGDGPGK